MKEMPRVPWFKSLMVVMLVMGVIALGTALIILPPIVFIWCINTIFDMSILITPKIWFAVWLLIAVTNGPVLALKVRKFLND